MIGYDAENIVYSAFCYDHVENIYSSFFCCQNNANIYMCGGITDSQSIFYSKYISGSANIYFSTNLIGCEECIFCDGLENQKYSIQNRAYSREEYLEKKAEILKKKEMFGSWYTLLSQKRAKNI